MKKFIYTAFILFLAIQLTSAQRASRLSSPDVSPDNSITFRYYSPNSKKVFLSTEILKEQLAMNKDDKGVWTVTLPKVKPDIYPYSFIVDGLEVADPNNTYVFAN